MSDSFNPLAMEPDYNPSKKKKSNKVYFTLSDKDTSSDNDFRAVPIEEGRLPQSENALNKFEETKNKFKESFDEIIMPDRQVNEELSLGAKILKLSVSVAFFSGWIILYILSLFSCQKSQAECLEMLTQETAFLIGIELFGSAFIFVMMSVLAWINIIYIGFLYASFPAMLFLFYSYDIGADFSSHGSYNRAFFYLFTIITSIIIGILYLFIKCLIKSPKITLFSIFSLIFIIYMSIKDAISTSCQYWDKGFSNTQIQKGGVCPIPIPETCFMYYTSNFWDVTQIRGLNCKNERSDEEYEILKLSKKNNTKRIGFPRTEHMPFFPNSTLSEFNKNIFNNMVDMDRDLEKADDVEVYIDYSRTYPEVKIQVKKNQTLINERSKLYEKNKSNTRFKNVLFIYIDSLSRNSFRRKLKKTYAWLENKYKNPLSKFSSYQFLKYHSLNYYTYANMIPGYFGVHKFDGKGKYFLYDAKESGYITGQSYDVCERETWDLEMAFKPYLNFTNYDHEFNGFYCDPVFSDPEKPYGALKGAYSVVRKCMYGKDAGEHQIEYTKQFFDTYKDQPKFFRLGFLDAHEGTAEVIKYMDEPIVELLNYLEKNGHLEDTLIQFQSDHGMSMPGPIYLIKPLDYFYEVFLPSLFYVMPKGIRDYDEIHQNLLSNENEMITSFDTHAGLLNLFNKNNKKTQFGVSLFDNKIKDEVLGRSCENYKIESKYCMCYFGGLKKK
jgi:hypothetical protein